MKKKKKEKREKSLASRGKDQKKSITVPKQPEPPKRFLWIQPPKDEWLGWICFTGIIILSFLMSFHTLSGVDIFWHLKTGENIFQIHRVPIKDIYSFTIAHKEWIDAQWLFQLVIYIFYRISGYTGMILLGSILTAITWTLILLPGYDSKKYFRIIPLALISLFAVSGRLRLRPELFTFFFLALELVLLHLYRRGKRMALYPIPVLIWLWVNSQGLWPIGFFLLAAILGEQVLALPQFGLEKYFKLASGPGGKKGILEMGICLAGSALLIWLNPYSWKGIVFPLKLLWETSSSESFIGSHINELQTPFSMYEPLGVWSYIILIVFCGMLFTFLISSRRLPLADLIICGAFFYISATARRNVPLFAMVTAMLGGKLILNISESGQLRMRRFSHRLLRFRPLIAGILVIAMIWLSGEIISSRFFIWDKLYCRFGTGVLETEYPIRASQFLKSISELGSVKPMKLFTDISSAGYLIWAGYPVWKVYVDPRMELYGEQFIKRYSSLFDNWQEFNQEDRKYNFDLLIVNPNISSFIQNLYYSPAWVLIYLDGTNVVFLKNQPSFSQAIQDYRMNLKEKLNTPLPKNLDGVWMARERNNRGVLLNWLKHRELAVYEFEDGIKYDSNYPNLIHNLGLALNRFNRYQEALPYLEKNAKNNPEDIPGHIELAWALASTGKPDGAIRILQGILNASPNEISACMKLAKVYEMVKEKDRAYAQWQRCWEISRQDPIKFKPQADEISEALKQYQGMGFPGIDDPPSSFIK